LLLGNGGRERTRSSGLRFYECWGGVPGKEKRKEESPFIAKKKGGRPKTVFFFGARRKEKGGGVRNSRVADGREKKGGGGKGGSGQSHVLSQKRQKGEKAVRTSGLKGGHFEKKKKIKEKGEKKKERTRGML